MVSRPVEDFAQEFRDTNALSRDNFHGSPTWRGSCSTDAMVYKNYCLQFLKQTLLIDKQHMALSFLNGLSRKKRAQMMVVDLGDRTTKPCFWNGAANFLGGSPVTCCSTRRFTRKKFPPKR